MHPCLAPARSGRCWRAQTVTPWQNVLFVLRQAAHDPLLVPRPLHCPEGTGSPSGSPQPGLLREVCPSSDSWDGGVYTSTLPSPCRSHHHLPSPGRPPASISTLLTRPSAARARFCPLLVPCVHAGARSRVAPRATDAAAGAAGRAAGAAGSVAAAWTAAEAAVWPPGWAMAAARAPVRASQAAFSRSSRAAAAAAVEAVAAAERLAEMAAWEAAARRTQPGSRGRRPLASRGGARRAPRGSFDACISICLSCVSKSNNVHKLTFRSRVKTCRFRSMERKSWDLNA